MYKRQVVGVTGVRSKRITKQIHLSFLINDTEFENTFLVVKGLSLDIILGNDFLQRNKAIVNLSLIHILHVPAHIERITRHCLLYTSRCV